MTHTEESLMALANRMYSAPAGTLKDMIEGELRLAISEVLADERSLRITLADCKASAEKAEAERDALAMQLKLKPAPMADCPVYCKTAVDLQAECERLRELIAELDGHEGAEGWSEGMRERIDAAMKEQP